jgi:hypothetical protein
MNGLGASAKSGDILENSTEMGSDLGAASAAAPCPI